MKPAGGAAVTHARARAKMRNSAAAAHSFPSANKEQRRRRRAHRCWAGGRWLQDDDVDAKPSSSRLLPAVEIQ